MAKYFFETPELEKQIREIRRMMLLMKNGVVADSMREKGIVYKMNWGVELPRIKEVAQAYTPNHDLAQRLWALRIRELQILATLLEPIDSFTPENALQWVADVENIEMAEQLSMNLFSKLAYSTSLAQDLVKSNAVWLQITGFTLAARVANNFDEEQIEAMLERAFELSATDDFLLYKAIGVSLARLCRRGKTVADQVIQKLAAFTQSEHNAIRYIRNEVEGELSFLEY